MDINAIEESIKRGTKSVFWRIILFGVSHILLTVLSLGLFAGFLLGCVFLIYLPFYLFPDDNTRADAGGVAGFIVYVSMMILVCAPFIWCGFQLVRHFILSLFLSPISKDKNRLEVTRDDCPELFALIVDIAEKTGNKTPELVYLSPEVNASVMYEHSGKFHISKNLVIGLGLLQGMNRDELKSVIAHEFGHFTQDTKNVSYLSYRLSLIIKRMMELAQAYNRRTQVARSKAKNKNNVNSWYLANWPISLITRKFADLYKDIAKKNSSLSRLMEYEADAVACRIVGARPFISSLHKLPVFQEWYDEYENVINGLLSENKSLASYWSGYDYVFNKISDDAQLHLTCRDIQTAEMGDNARYPSKVMVVDGYDTHPSVKSRIENILKINQTENPIDTTDARTLLPTEIMDLVGRLRQQVLAENLQESLAWSGVKEIGLDDFKAWADKEMKKTYVPHFLAPYTLRSVNSFSIPLPEEELQDPVESPFTAENREMLLEFNRCMADYQTLLQFSQEEPDKRHVMYKGKEYDCETALEEKKTYLESFEERLQRLDTGIYKYLWHRAKDKTIFNHEYWAMFYGYNNMCEFSSLMNDVNAVRGAEQSNFTDEKEVNIGEYLLTQLTREFWKYMRSFSYQMVYIVCRDWETRDNVPIKKMLDKWYAFASTDIPPYTSAADLFYMTDVVNDLFLALYNSGKTCWTKRLIRAYNNIEEPEEPEEAERSEVAEESGSLNCQNNQI